MRLPPFFDDVSSRYRKERGDLKVRYLADAVEKLSLMFTGRAPRPKHYLEDARLRQAYAYYFTPLNSVKVHWVLEELRGYDPEFLSRPLRVLDYGSGCGAGMLGLLHAGVQGTLQMFDFVRDVREEAQFYFDAYPDKKLNIEFIRTVREEDRYDLILLSNVVSELHDPKPVLKLLEHLDGYLIVIEPADQANTLALQKLRDEISRRATIAAPCLTQALCPMLQADPHMWCCMEFAFDRPKFINEVDARVGFDRKFLKFSYFVATRTGKTLGAKFPDDAWRLVGDVHRSKGRACAKVCGKSGTLPEAVLLSRDIGDASRSFLHAKRGDVLLMKVEEEGRVKIVERRKPLG
jgi:ribosomal protein RSM22 (predicted rRNA methylase)